MSLLSYSGVTTKVRAMSGKLLQQKDYHNLCTVASVQEYVNYIKKCPAYTPIFATINIDTLHRGDIEKLLTKSIYYDFSKIYRFSSARQRQFLDLYFLRFQVQIIKSLMRMIFDHRDPELNLDLYQDFFMKHSKMNLSRLTSSTNIHELIEHLKGTVFYQPLNKLEIIEHPTIFDYEMQLDLFYFVTIYNNCSKHLSGDDLLLIKNSFGIQIDLLNIQWIYRSKKYLNLSSTDLINIIIPIDYKLKHHQIRKLIESESLSEFEQLLRDTFYGNKFEIIENYSLEDAFGKLQRNLNKLDCRKNPYSVAVIKAYLYNKENEVQKLTTTLECIRYGYDPKDIEQYLQTEV